MDLILTHIQCFLCPLFCSNFRMNFYFACVNIQKVFLYCFAGHSCQCICKERLWESHNHCLSCSTGTYCSSSCFENFLLLLFIFYFFLRFSFLYLVLTTSPTPQLGLVLGMVLSLIVTITLKYASGIFTTDINVLRLLSLGIPVYFALGEILIFCFWLLKCVLIAEYSLL